MSVVVISLDSDIRVGPHGLAAQTELGHVSIGQDVVKVEASTELGRNDVSKSDGATRPSGSDALVGSHGSTAYARDSHSTLHEMRRGH